MKTLNDQDNHSDDNDGDDTKDDDHEEDDLDEGNDDHDDNDDKAGHNVTKFVGDADEDNDENHLMLIVLIAIFCATGGHQWRSHYEGRAAFQCLGCNQ